MNKTTLLRLAEKVCNSPAELREYKAKIETSGEAEAGELFYELRRKAKGSPQTKVAEARGTK